MTKEYIVLTVKNNNLSLDYKTIKENKNLINSNNIEKGCLFYTLKYIKKYPNEVISSINNFENIDKVDTLIIERLITFKYAKIIMEKMNLLNLKLNFSYTMSLTDFEEILSINSLKNIDVYYMPEFIKTKFYKKNISINSRNIYKISDKFILSQDCFDVDTLYYVKNLEIKENYDTLYIDLQEFLKVNNYLKAIHIKYYSKVLIERIIEFVKNDESKNIVVFLYQSNDKDNFITNNFEWLKKLNKKCRKEEICEFRIIYSNNFVKNNLFKQLTFNNLKLITILGMYVCVVAFVISKSYAYVEKLNIDKLNNELMNEISNNIQIEEDDQLPEEDITEEENIPQKEIKSKYTFDQTLSALKKINKDTVSFLNVKDTNISYPVVQTKDNNYYLNRDFYKSKRSMGWIYMDYRNNKKMTDDNTIIYGHSMKNGTMFGTLKKTLSSSWRRNEENMIIDLETDSGVKKYKIFSVYKVNYTTDYLRVKFDSKNSFNDFIKLIKGRSVFKSNEKIEYKDKILTLSTCTGTNNKRLVVHAVLIKEEEK